MAMGEEGYLNIAQQLMSITETLKNGINNIQVGTNACRFPIKGNSFHIFIPI